MKIKQQAMRWFQKAKFHFDVSRQYLILFIFVGLTFGAKAQGLIVNATITKVTCPDLSSGSINITVLNLLNSANYSWVGPNGFTSTSEDISGIGIGSYTVTVTPSIGVPVSATFFVSGNYSPPPVLKVFDTVDVALDETGNLTLKASDVIDTIYAACTVRSVKIYPTLSPSLGIPKYNCSDVNKIIQITIWAENGVGNPTVKTTYVRIIDATPPSLKLYHNVALQLNDNGISILHKDILDSFTRDVCTGRSITWLLNNRNFDCDDIPGVHAEIRAIDSNGNSYGDSVYYSVVGNNKVLNRVWTGKWYKHYIGIDDCTPPVAVCKTDTTLYLDSSGLATINVQDLDLGSTDNCAISIGCFYLDNGQFDCDDVGVHNYDLTVMDKAGNIACCPVEITVLDTIKPQIGCKDTTLSLDSNGMIELVLDDINAGTFDNCTFQSIDFSTPVFDCNSLGVHSVEMTVIDKSGAMLTCRSEITVEDQFKPVLNCKGAKLYLGPNGVIANFRDVVDTLWDNCGIDTSYMSKSQFSCSDAGINTITITAIDVNGNVSTCQTTVEVIDTLPPTAVCKDYIAYLDINGTVTISVNDVDGGSYTGCSGVASISIDKTNFSCNEIGHNTVTLTITDGNGNSSVCYADVEVKSYPFDVKTTKKIYNGGYNVSCSGANDGEITTTITNGCGGPYTYVWSTGVTTQNLTNIPAGTYWVKVTDQSGNVDYDTVVISEPASITFNTSSTNISCGGNVKTTCTIAQFASGKHAIWLPDVPGVTSPDFVFSNNSGKLEQFPNGTARVTGTIENKNDPSYIFEVDVWFTNAMDWNQWSALGRTYKGTHAAAHANHEDWMYYEFDASKSNTLKGLGSYLGVTLNLTHRPTNYKVGLQIGIGANDKDGDYGMSTWFNHTGTYAGRGDFNFDGSCQSGKVCDGTASVSNIAGGASPYTIQWSTGSSTNTLSDLCAGTYTVTVTDANGCYTVDTTVVSEPQELTLSLSSTDASCSSGNNGSASVSVSGGQAPYTYSWSTGATTSSISNLSEGEYSVTVEDAAGCIAIESVKVDKPDCCNVTNGGTIAGDQSNCGPFDPQAFTSPVLPSGGLGTIEYLWLKSDTLVINTVGNQYWSPIANSNSATYDPGTVTKTTYYIRCARRSGCDFYAGESNIIAVIVNPEVTVSVNGNDVSCYGGNDGSALATVSGGTAPFTYSWSNGATVANPTGLYAGTLMVTVTDKNGCSDNATVTIGQPSQVSLSTSSTETSCVDGVDGSATVSATGGTAPYSYLWSTGATGSSANNLAQGTYTVTVTDANGCTSNTSVQVSGPTAIQTTVSVQDLKCITNYTQDTDTTFTSTSCDCNGRMQNFVVVYSGSNGATFEISSGSKQKSCVPHNDITGVNNGDTVVISGDWKGGRLGPKTYVKIGNKTYEVHTSCSEEIVGNTYGPITVIGYTDGDGNVCNGPTTTTITTQTLTSPTDGSPCDCEGRMYQFVVAYSGPNNATLTSTTGSSSSTVSAANVTGINNGDEITITGDWKGGRLGAKTFVTINGTTYEVHTSCSENIMGNTYGPLTVISYTDGAGNTCNGFNYYGCNGSASVSISGGTAPYNVVWSNGDTGLSADSLCDETYYVTITDANGCVRVDTVVVGEPDPIVMNENVSDVSCHGCMTTNSCDINFSTLSNGEIISNQYQNQGVSISAVSNNSSSPYNNLIVFNTNLTGTQDPDLEINVGNVLIFPENMVDGNNDGKIDNPDDDVYGGTVTMTFASARELVSFDFYDKDGGQTGWAKAYDANNNLLKQVTIVNAGDASTQTLAFNTQGVSKLVIWYYDSGAFGNFKFNCGTGGTCDGEIDINPSGGESPYTYEWSNGATTQDVSGLTPGSYTVIVTDANGCSESATFEVGEPTELVVSVTGSNNSCYSGNSGSVDLSVNGGTPGYSFSWEGPGAFSATTEDIDNLVAGTYTVTVTDSRGCSDAASVTITQPDNEIVISGTKQDVSCVGNTDGSVDISVSGGTVTTSTSTVWLENFENNNIGQEYDNGSTAWDQWWDAYSWYSDVESRGGSKVFEASNGQVKWYSESINISGQTSVDLSAKLYSRQGGYLESSGTNVDFIRVFYRVNGGSWVKFQTNGDNYGELSSGGITASQTGISGNTVEIKVYMKTTADNEYYYIDDIMVTGTSVTGAYTYSWSNGETTEDIDGLAAGTYTVTVADQSGCSTTKTFTVGSPNPIVLGGTTTDVSCADDCNQEIAVYDYNGSRSFYMYGLAHGNEPNWTLSNGKLTTYCDGTAHFTGEITNKLYSSKQFDCSIWFKNKSDWSSWNAQGKTWKGNATTVGTRYQDWTYYDFDESKSNVLIGKNYYSGFTVDLTQRPSNKTMGLQIGEGANDKDGDVGLSTWFYYDGWFQGCQYSGEGDINSDATISGGSGCNGAVDITVLYGTAPYNYSWSNGASTEDLSDVCDGNYTVTVTDANGCTATKTYTVGNADPISASATATQSACGGGSIDVSVSGGSSPYTYAWTGPNNYSATSQDITVNDAGTYELTITDANGCSETVSAVITNSADLAVSTSTTSVDCNGNSTGSATASLSGGTSPYSYSWSNGATSATASNLAAGTYYVTVTDNNGCSIIKSVVVSEPAELSVTMTPQVQANGHHCGSNGSTDGSISTTVSGGTSPYTYTWNGGGGTTTVTRTISNSNDDAEEDVCGYVYTNSSDLELVNDGNAGNQVIGLRFRNIYIPRGATIVDAYIQFTTEGTTRNTTSSSMTIRGEKRGWSYTFDSYYCADISSRNKTNSSVSWSPSAWYTLDEAGSNQKTPDLKNIAQEIVNLNGWDSGDPMTFIISGSGRREAYSYDGSAGKAPKLIIRYSTGVSGANPTNLGAGTYVLTVTDANGCSVTDSVTLTEPTGSTPFASDNSTASIAEKETEIAITIGPNPVISDGTISITANTSERIEVAITDMTGKELIGVFAGDIMESSTNTFITDMSGLSAGMYQVQVKTESGTVVTEKVVVAR